MAPPDFAATVIAIRADHSASVSGETIAARLRRRTCAEPRKNGRRASERCAFSVAVPGGTAPIPSKWSTGSVSWYPKLMVLRWFAEVLGSERPEAATTLEGVIQRHVGNADEETTKMIVAAAGLLGTVAYADRDYSAAEETRVRAELARVPRLSAAGVDAVCAVLRQQIVTIATVQAPIYARALRELTEPGQRREILDVLVDLAAADDEITVAETNVLRQTATALGLSQDDYNASQQRHRDKLKVLKPAR